ncbi:MAG TPA: hypothetical protein VKZ71_03860 [Burkholderiaceae bacterium]|nr:hypothetical protein [Burkholderiaceae bacterium]
MNTKQTMQFNTCGGRFSAGSMQRNNLSRATVVSDILLVLAWAAAIPGLMWLGVAGGF